MSSRRTKDVEQRTAAVTTQACILTCYWLQQVVAVKWVSRPRWGCGVLTHAHTNCVIDLDDEQMAERRKDPVVITYCGYERDCLPYCST
jgi:hypothetical protein